MTLKARALISSRRLQAALVATAMAAGSLALAASSQAATPSISAKQEQGLTTMWSGQPSGIGLSVGPEVGWNAGLESLTAKPANYYRLWDMKVAWRDTNPSAGVFDFSILDKRIAQVEAWGGRPVMVLGLTPQWAASDSADKGWGAGAASPPSDMSTWRAYVKAVVARYGSRIAAYETWNEANLQTFWTGTAGQMAEMTRIAAQEIGNSAIVLAPSVTTRLPGGKKFSAEYVTALGESGTSVIDAWTLHTYPAGNAGPSPEEACAARANGIIEWQKTLIDTVGPTSPYLSKQLWDTEVNYGLAGPGATPHTDWNDAAGSVLLECTYDDSKYLGVDVTFWYEYTAAPFSLLGVQFTPSTLFMNAAWNGLAGHVAAAERNAWIPKLGDGAATPATETPTVDPSAGTTPVPPVTVLQEQQPTAGGSVTVIGGAVATCSQTSSATGTITGCGAPPVKLYCSAGPILGGELQGRVSPAALLPGLYVSVMDGMVQVTTPSWMSFSPGQFGYTPGFVQPPVVLPTNPGLQFSPPPVFDPNAIGTAPSGSQSSNVDCEVRSRSGAALVPQAKAAKATGANIPVGGTLHFQAGGYAPKSSVSMYLNSSTTPIGSLLTDDTGRVAGWVRVPSGTSLGTNRFQLVGTLADKRTAGIITGFTVHAPKRVVLSTSTALSATAKKLSPATVKALTVFTNKLPTTIPSGCAIAATAQGKSRAAVAAQAALAKAKMAGSGITCSTKVKAGSANKLTVVVRTAK